MTRKPETPDLNHEQALWKGGFPHIAGLDEAGRGALAGPVAVGAVILPQNDPHLSRTLACSRDSKQMTHLQRERCAPIIKATALAWSVAFASADEIDQFGIVAATRLAGMRALSELKITPHYLLTDYRMELPESGMPQTSLPKGDARSLSIACASVLAKTTRDAFMCALDEKFPAYGLRKNKGYGTQAHRSVLKRLGYSSIHRKTFSFKE
ncbi:MAG: hypothetical protein Kow002_04300 [Anaerolineales bacterium]